VVSDRVVVVGASAGGVEALQVFVAGLPDDLPAPVLVVLHIPAEGPSVLPKILARAGRLPVAVAEDGEELTAGRVYTAPSDRHLLVDGGRVRLTAGPKENGVRPAIDVSFRSAAEQYGPAAVGVVLTGTLDDGAAGLAAIVKAGGHALVQDPAEALYPSMPTAALAATPGAHAAPVADLGKLVAERLADPPPQGGSMDDPADTYDQPSPFSCPDCGGVLWHTGEDWRHFRCRFGHGYSAQALLNGQRGIVEEALWTAIRVLEERVDLSRRLASQAEAAGRHTSAKSFAERGDQVHAHLKVLRELVGDLMPYVDQEEAG